MKKFAGDLTFLLATIFVSYAIGMLALSLVEGGITAEDYARGVRPSVEQTLEDARTYGVHFNR